VPDAHRAALDPARLARARAATAAAFASQAFVFIAMTTRLPTAQEQWGIGTTALSLVLLMMVLLSGVGSLVADAVARRTDSAAALRAGLALTVVAVPVIVLGPSLVVGAAGLAVYGVGLGMVDAASNMQAVAIEHALGRPILPSFHGAWTLGGIAAAGLAVATSDLATWLPALSAIVPAVVATGPLLAGDRGADHLAEPLTVPWRPIVLVGTAMALFYLVDVAVQTWGATYTHDVFDTSKGTAAAAVFAYLLASGTLRLAGDGLVRRYGVVKVLRIGAVVGVVGLVGVVVAPSVPVALTSFALAGAGLACVAPLSFSAAARLARGEDAEHRRAQVDAVIARFNLFNYAGALLGAVLTGLVGAGDLRWGFVVPAVLTLALLPLARAFVPGRPAMRAS